MLRKSPVEFFARFAENVVRARLDSSKLSKPMVTSLYVTMKCNFRCTYCDDGSGNMYPHLPEPDRLDTEKTLQVIEIIRRASPGFNITGGEPTVRGDIDVLYEKVGELGFWPVTFNTNAFLLDRHLSILKNIDFLVVSLDTVDLVRGDSLIDVGDGGQSERVLANLTLAGDYRKANRLSFDTIINTVIFPETIDDAWDVWELCLERGWLWSPMPHVVGKYPNPGLVDNPRWLELVDAVLAAKKVGAKIYGNFPSLRAIRDFTRFECYPTTRPIVYPNGDLMYPCAPLGTVGANLLETGDYFKAVEAGMRKHGAVPYCDSRCHLGCFMETSTSLTYPDEALLEAARFFDFRKRVPRVRRPPRQTAAGMPPPFQELRALPSMTPDEIRRARREGKLENDFSSRLRLKRSRTALQILEPETAAGGGCGQVSAASPHP
jgi:MoaA/NifB/PqqE/SkfB family radical SAM enzyme